MGKLIATKDATDKQLAATWNVLQMSMRMWGDKSDLPPKIKEVKEELTKRGIPFEDGKRIKVAT